MNAPTTSRSFRALLVLLSAAAAAGCGGKVGSGEPGGSAGTSSPAGGTGTAAGNGSVTPGAGSGGVSGATDPTNNPVPISTPGSTTPIPPESAGPLMMKRLTYREYDHILADLLGDTSAPAEGGSGWSPDAQNDTGYVVPNGVADLQVELYRQTADTVIENAVKKVAAGTAAGKFIIPCKAPATTAAETTCATQFITAFGLAAYRRPVAATEQAGLLALFTQVRGLGLDFTHSIGTMAKALIQSPGFLYHWEIGPTKPAVGSDGLVALTPWQMASRLADSLWETMPDDTLLQEAQAGRLSTPAQVVAQATRMLADARSSQALFNFHQQWLFTFGSQGRDLSQLLVKTNPAFTPAAAQAVQNEFAQFVSSVYAGDGTLQSLFTAPYAFVNHDLAAIYGVAAPATGIAKVALDPTQRGGIFTQTAFLAMLANDGADNPVYRGLSIYLKVLCGTVGSPPPNVPAVNFKMDGTTRQSYDAHGSAACAAGCHNLFDPPGFAFENYDGIGAYRTQEAGQSVDATGSFVTPGKATLSFKNALDLSRQLADSAEARTCIERQWTRYMLGRMESTAEEGSLGLAFQKASATTGFSVRDLLVSLLASKSFMYRLPSTGEAL